MSDSPEPITKYGITWTGTTRREYDETVPVSPSEQVAQYESTLRGARSFIEGQEVYEKLSPQAKEQLKELAEKGHEADIDPEVIKGAFEILHGWDVSWSLWLLMYQFVEEKFPGYPLELANKRAREAVRAHKERRL